MHCDRCTGEEFGFMCVVKRFRNIFVMETYPRYDSMTLPWEKLHEKNSKHTFRHTIKHTVLEAVVDLHRSVIVSQRGRREGKAERKAQRVSTAKITVLSHCIRGEARECVNTLETGSVGFYSA